METRYPIRAVAKITGLSLDTLRAWERRYKAVEPEHTHRGRQYGAADIERLLLLNQLVQKGHAIGGIATLGDQELRNLVEQQPARPSAELGPARDILAPVISAVENFDSLAAGDELSRLAAVLSPRDLVYEVAVPLMREVGIRWHDGTLAIAQEHLVSHLLRNLLGSMLRLIRPSQPPIRMVLGTPAGESHEFGILACAMLASIAGIEPVYLGPDLPAREIANAAQRTAAKVVVLAVTVPTARTGDEVSALANALPETIELWVGNGIDAPLDLPVLGRRVLMLRDFAAFENECRRWRTNQ